MNNWFINVDVDVVWVGIERILSPTQTPSWNINIIIEPKESDYIPLTDLHEHRSPITYFTTTYINININMKRPQHITITSIKYLISYPINMKVSNQVFTTSNSNKCVGGLCSC